jgi:hypothetical protein
MINYPERNYNGFKYKNFAVVGYASTTLPFTTGAIANTDLRAVQGYALKPGEYPKFIVTTN